MTRTRQLVLTTQPRAAILGQPIGSEHMTISYEKATARTDEAGERRVEKARRRANEPADELRGRARRYMSEHPDEGLSEQQTIAKLLKHDPIARDLAVEHLDRRDQANDLELEIRKRRRERDRAADRAIRDLARGKAR